MSIPRIVLLLAAGVFLFAVSRGIALRAGPPPGPRALVTPAEADLGTVAIGTPVERTFFIRNMGDDRLLITDVKSTCQCTVTELPTRIVAPGDSVTLHVTFTGRSAGPRSQTVRVDTNDPKQRTRLIKIHAQVTSVTASPKRS